MNIIIACMAAIVATVEPRTAPERGRAAPTITSLTPSQVVVGALGVTLVVRGSEFTHNATVRWNGSDRPTTYLSASELHVTIPSTDFTTVGSVPVTVFVQGGNGGLSNATIFTIGNPLPRIVALTPSSATIGGQPFTLAVDGADFVPGAAILWNGVPRATTLVSVVRVTTQVASTDLVRGPVQVTVVNPRPGGGTSASRSFTMIEPSPVAPVATAAPRSVDAITTVSIAANPPPDLEVKIAQTANAVIAGTQQQYTVKVFNRGGLVARPVVLRVALPPDLEFVSNAADHSFVCSRSGTTFNCASGVVAGHDSATIHVTMKLASTATPGHSLVFGATADPDRAIPESNEYNNSAGASATTQAAPVEALPMGVSVPAQISRTLVPKPNYGAPIFIPASSSKTFSFTIWNHEYNHATVVVAVTAETDLLGQVGAIVNPVPPEFKLELIDPSGTVVETKTVDRGYTSEWYGVGHHFHANGVWKLKITNLKTTLWTLKVRAFKEYEVGSSW